MGATYHNLTLAIVEPYEEPRRRIADWIAAWELSRKWPSTAMAVWARERGAEGGA